jgi:hypothetical protein
MLYILRLADGSCLILLAADEKNARLAAKQLDNNAGDAVVSVRALENFGVKVDPNEDGSLEISGWNGAALDSILANEYPLLYGAYRRANAEPFAQGKADVPVMRHLKAEFQRNTDLMREALALEKQRCLKGQA